MRRSAYRPHTRLVACVAPFYAVDAKRLFFTAVSGTPGRLVHCVFAFVTKAVTTNVHARVVMDMRMRHASAQPPSENPLLCFVCNSPIIHMYVWRMLSALNSTISYSICFVLYASMYMSYMHVYICCSLIWFPSTPSPRLQVEFEPVVWLVRRQGQI